MRKSIDHMTFQSDRVQIRKIFADYKIPPDEQNDIINLLHDLSKIVRYLRYICLDLMLVMNQNHILTLI